jgi:hypothetical protein
MKTTEGGDGATTRDWPRLSELHTHPTSLMNEHDDELVSLVGSHFETRLVSCPVGSQNPETRLASARASRIPTRERCEAIHELTHLVLISG